MPYSFKPHHALSRDMRAIVDRQLSLALLRLQSVGTPSSDDAVHEARRHLKKILALLRLLKPALGGEQTRALARIRTASRLLAPIADAEALVDTSHVLGPGRRPRLGHSTVSVMRAGLLEREAAMGRTAVLNNVLPKVVRILAAEQKRAAAWRPQSNGFQTLVPGLKRSMRRARRCMRHASMTLGADAFHVWRRRVKDLWLQVRLLQARCGTALNVTERQLEQLDGLLGQHHNLALLERVLLDEPLLSRRATAQSLRVVRARRAALGRRALVLGGRALVRKPRAFVRHIADHWTAMVRVKAPSGRTSR